MIDVNRPKSAIIYPFLGSGLTPGGFYVEYDDRLYPVLGRILRVSPDFSVAAVGDVVVYRHNTTELIPIGEGNEYYLIEEKNVQAVLAGYDQELENVIA